MKQISKLYLAVLILASLASAALAQNYPDRPIRLIVPYGAGAGVDTMARLTSAVAEPILGQKFVVENKPGAGARLGALAAARSAPDGYNLLFAAPAIVVAQIIPPTDFSLDRDLQPLVLAVNQPQVLVVRSGLGVNSVDQFVDYAKRNPGKMTFGVQGVGTEMHLTVERFKKVFGIDLNVIPYNVAATAIVDLLADRLDAMFLVVPPIKEHLASRSIVPLATLSPRRIKVMPDVPTMAELGRPELTSVFWFGYFAPAKTPQAAVDRLVRALQATLKDGELAGKLDTLGAELVMAGPSEFAKVIAEDRAKYSEIAAEMPRPN